MPEINQDIDLWRGNSLIMRVTITDQDGKRLDLTDVVASWWMAKNATTTEDADMFVKKDSDTLGGVTIQHDTDADYLLVTILPADTEDLKPGTFYHEAQILDPAANIYTVMTGKFTLKPAVIPPR